MSEIWSMEFVFFFIDMFGPLFIGLVVGSMALFYTTVIIVAVLMHRRKQRP